MISEKELARLEGLCAEAEPGPWVHEEGKVYCEEGKREVASTWKESGYWGTTQELMDGRFIAASRTALPLLLKEIREARALIREARDSMRAMCQGIATQAGTAQFDAIMEVAERGGIGVGAKLDSFLRPQPSKGDEK